MAPASGENGNAGAGGGGGGGEGKAAADPAPAAAAAAADDRGDAVGAQREPRQERSPVVAAAAAAAAPGSQARDEIFTWEAPHATYALGWSVSFVLFLNGIDSDEHMPPPKNRATRKTHSSLFFLFSLSSLFYSSLLPLLQGSEE